MLDQEKEMRRFTVVAAVIRDHRGRILVTRRPSGTHMAGLWEFPGGKIEDGESPEEALGRELTEELGIEADVGRPLTFAVHREEDLEILLLFYEAAIGSGEPVSLEGQEIRWVSPEELDLLPMPPADQGVIALLTESAPGSVRS